MQPQAATNSMQKAIDAVSKGAGQALNTIKDCVLWLGRQIAWVSKEGYQWAQKSFAQIGALVATVVAWIKPLIGAAMDFLKSNQGILGLVSVGSLLCIQQATNLENEESYRMGYGFLAIGAAAFAGAFAVQTGVVSAIALSALVV